MFFAGAAGDQFFQYGIKSMIGQRCLIKRREADIEIFASFLVEKFSECLHIVGAAVGTNILIKERIVHIQTQDGAVSGEKIFSVHDTGRDQKHFSL